jgi:hypothetical protein
MVMKLTDIPFAAMRLQYRIARAPLRLFEHRVIAQMDSEAPGRLLFERSVGSIDALVGTVLRDDDVASRGAEQMQRSQALGEAVRLDQVAAQQRAEADDELRRKRNEAVAAPGKARVSTVRKVQDARSTAEQRKHEETEKAAKRTAAAKERIDQAAEAKVNAAESIRRDEEKRIAAAEKTATAVADARLEDAADKRKKAVKKSAHADRLEDLAETERGRR